MLAKTTVGIALLGLAAFGGASFEAQGRLQTKVQRHDRQLTELERKVKSLESAQRALNSTALPKAQMNLHDSSAKGEITQMRYALNAGDPIDLKNANAVTPLMAASSSGKLRATRYLLVNGADYRLKNKKGLTALAIAKKAGHEKVIALLIDFGAK